jgi:hypothetical protein
MFICLKKETPWKGQSMVRCSFEFAVGTHACVSKIPRFPNLLFLNLNVYCYWQMNKKLQQLKGPKKKQLQATKLSVEGRGMLKYL